MAAAECYFNQSPTPLYSCLFPCLYYTPARPNACAFVCLWLGGTKSRLYKCTLKQLPQLLTAALTRTSDCAASALAYSGGNNGYTPFTLLCALLQDTCLQSELTVCNGFEKQQVFSIYWFICGSLLGYWHWPRLIDFLFSSLFFIGVKCVFIVT